VLQHFGELTFFVTLLAHIARARGAVAAAETLLAVTASIRTSLQCRLSSVLHSSPALGAAEYFTLLAQTRKLLSRCKELVQTLVGNDVRRPFLDRLTTLQDEVFINFGVSDRAAAFLRDLPLAAVAASPLLRSFLSGPYSNLMPPLERARLSLPRSVTPHIAFSHQHPLSIRCQGGSVVPVPLDLLRPLSRLASLVDIFARWQAQAYGSGSAAATAAPSLHSSARQPPVSHRAVPLPVQAHVLRTILDCAFGVTMEPLLGGERARRQYLHEWAATTRRSPALHAAVRDFAALAGFGYCVRLLDGCEDMPSEL
jgi:hypothetical protein